MTNKDKKLSSEEKEELKDDDSEVLVNGAEKEKVESEEVLDEIDEKSHSDQLEEKLLRAQAEIQNLRRISQNELIKARLYGSENLVKDLNPSIDNLFRTLENQDTENKTVPSEEP